MQDRQLAGDPGRWPAVGVFGLVGLVAAALFIVRMTGPPDVMDAAQHRQAAYVLDAVQNGRWICQQDEWGEVTSKPPLYTWLAAGVTMAAGRISRWSLALPAGVATLAAAWIILATGRWRFGFLAGFLAGFAYILSPIVAKQVSLSRTDGLFVLTVVVAALAGFRAWERGRGWTWFWVAAAAATLTKGPLGLVLAAGGFLAVVWERWEKRQGDGRQGDGRQGDGRQGDGRQGDGRWEMGDGEGRSEGNGRELGAGGFSGGEASATRCVAAHVVTHGVGRGSGHVSMWGHLWRAHVPGVGLYLLITLGWFGLAYLQVERALIDKMIGDELIGHTLRSGKGQSFGEGLYKPAGYFLGRFFPWSVLAVLGLWRVCWAPSAEVVERRFERFCFCWFFVGLVIFSMAAHQRGDLLMPIVPPAALLAGRELARWLSRVRVATPVVVGGAAMAVAVAGVVMIRQYHHDVRSNKGRIVQTMGMKELAEQLRSEMGEVLPLTYVDSPFALQFYLNTMRSSVSYEQAAELLADDAAAFVVVREKGRLVEQLGPDAAELHVLAAWEGDGGRVKIVSNHPRLEWTDRMGAWAGPVMVQTEGIRLIEVKERVVRGEAESMFGVLRLRNVSDQAHRMKVILRTAEGEMIYEHVIEPAEIWELRIPEIAGADGP